MRHDGEVWLSSWGAGLFRYEEDIDGFVKYDTDAKGRPLVGLKVVSMCEYGERLVLALNEGRLVDFCPENGMLQETDCPQLSGIWIRDMAVYGSELWIATHSGIFILDERMELARCLSYEAGHPYGLSENGAYTLYADSEGRMWVGLLSNGVDYLPCADVGFEVCLSDVGLDTSEKMKVRGMVCDENGTLYVGTETHGVFGVNSQTGDMRHYELASDEKSGVLSMAYFDGRVFCGVYQQGLYIIDVNTEKVEFRSSAEMQIGQEDIYALCFDGKGRCWMGTDRGLYLSEVGTSSFCKVREVGRGWIFSIFEDCDGWLWMGTMGDGLWKYHPERKELHKYIHETGNPNSIGSSSVSSVMQTGDGTIWVSTDRGGLCRYEADKDAFSVFSLQEGLPDEVVYNVLEDASGNLWFGTNRGLVCLDTTLTVRTFTKEHGLPDNQFSYNAAVSGTGGRMYFGGMNGVVAFDAGKIRFKESAAPLYFTKLLINNEKQMPVGEDSPLECSIVHSKAVRLSYNRTNICLTMSLLCYPSAASTRFFYRLAPVESDWKLAEDAHLSYAGLPVGDYRLQVKAIDGCSGQWSSREVDIIVLPPWWRTPWAYLLYIIIGISSVWLVLRNYHIRQERRLRIRQRFMELEKQKELYEAKVDFFTWATEGDVRVPLLPEHKREREKKARTSFVQMLNEETNEADKQLADKIIRVIEDNLMDESFSVEVLAELLCMSRSTLLRCMKRLFDRSPVEVIRMVRLKKASELIRRGGYRISDIGYMVGFSSASYFSKNFQIQFGLSPKEFAKRCQDEKNKLKAEEIR